MKIFSLISVLSIMVFVTSCKKDNKSDSATASQDAPRTIRFTLYTDKDFSNDDQNVLFNVFIQTASNQPIWDSTFTAMKVRDIPSLANKIAVEKTIKGYANNLLKVGFRYTLTGVGDSWHYDASSPGVTFTEVIFNFQ